MLPRVVDVSRLLHLRQRTVTHKFWLEYVRYASADTPQLRHTNVLCRHVGSQQHRKMCYTFLLRSYTTTKDKKMAASPVLSTSGNAKFTDKPAVVATATPQAVTVANVNTEPEREMPRNTEIKKIDIETSKGILSVTTTIEDSKINDVVFEKTKSKSKPLTMPPAGGKTEEVLKDIATMNEPKTPTITSTMSHDTTKASATAAAAAVIAMTSVSKPPPSPKPKRICVDLNRSSLERNFITPARAMTDFLLKASDLESLPKIKRRSPYEQEPPMTVYWRKDVEAKAIEVWGSLEDLRREILKREIEQKKHQQNIFTMKRRLRDYRREMGQRAVMAKEDLGLRGKSGTVVLIAIGINGVNCLFKACGWLFTGSHSMFAECIHSMADTINQMILAYGIHKSVQRADEEHPYGYANMKYVSSLISGVGIFCLGTGLSYYHGIMGILHPEPITDYFWAFFILGGALVSEGATLLVAMNEVRRSARLLGISFKEYVLTGKDPCVNVVLMEDAAAVASVAVAVTCMGMTSITGSPIFDAIGSMLVGSILGGVASFIIYTNAAALVGKSISEEQLNKINTELETDVMIRAIHDVKGIDMGNSLVRYKAELDFDGRELTRSYLDKQDLNELLRVVKSFQTVEELEQFLLSHGENIVDLMGGEIDRIEMKLRKKFPQIRHCDLEIL